MSPDQRRDDDPPVPGWDAVVAHNKRFRQVADRYPRRVAQAYGGDFERAAADSDDVVAVRHGRRLGTCPRSAGARLARQTPATSWG